jgi:hypothetical protein
MQRGQFLHEPRTEQEVVCLFGALLSEIEPPMAIEAVQTAFPDCLAQDLATGKTLRIEFELYGSHFREHGHRIDQCDMIVCWRDDHAVWPPGIEVIELAEVVNAKRPDLIVADSARRPDIPWNEGAFVGRARADGVPDRVIGLMRRIIAFAAAERLGPQWLKNPQAVFAVGDRRQFFKVWSRGTLSLPFSRLEVGPLFPELIRRLNAAAPRLGLTEADRHSKGRGGELSELFDSEEQLDRFLRVWTWFRDAG